MKQFVLNFEKVNTYQDYYLLIKKTLNFPDYFGMNMHATLDCMRDFWYEDPYEKVELTIQNFGKLINIDESIMNIYAILNVFNIIKIEQPDKFKLIIEL